MRRRLALVGILLFASGVMAGETGVLTKKIDERLAKVWKEAGVEPSAMTDDATFLRRVSLDLIGRIPTVAESREFLADSRPDKRSRLVDNLLDSPGYANHFATSWRRTWMPQADTRQFSRLGDDFEDWLVSRLRQNTGYDRMVQELLTVPTGTAYRRGFQPVSPEASPVGFFVASEQKPENLAANTARAFLGINLDCAQCHNHPFARRTRDQFWQTAAFFAKPTGGSDTMPAKLELGIPDTKKTVSAKLLTDGKLNWPVKLETDTGRELLAKWVTEKENPYFAKNAVNRLWAHFFGIGIAEPLDDLSGDNPPSHPELLDDLAASFAESKYDLKSIIKSLVLSRAYQLSSTGSPASMGTDETRLFNRAPVRGLTGEQLFDSLRLAAGLPAERSDRVDFTAEIMNQGGTRGRKAFAARFLIDRPVTAQRSIVQALSLMNGRLTGDLSTADKSPALAAAADAPFLDTKGKVETLFFATLGRNPTEAELVALVKHVDSGGAEKNPTKALADVFWALLNSSEFNTNH
ncbi:DUF1549 and DUF1553 domain-containing protein [Zavarzinella formosa]|uniref:DUF1549 and DUF1553 domain-containing protein n=1 Tax=Zavarzinella formosa TaxID=360055 RepID=UPI0002E750B1|nr:DUF1549 and DUF1553 domain-containing protein [Zavarzinella formosa]